MQNAKSDPILIEQARMRMSIGHRKGLGGNDEGLTFDITTADSAEGKRILRYDCFYDNPHYHIGAGMIDQQRSPISSPGWSRKS